jgi:membrane protease YdiL (CAAX protease family)
MRGKLVAWLLFVGALIALAYGDRAAAGKPPKDALYEYSFAVAELVQYAVILGIVLWIAGRPERQRLLGLRLPSSWPRALGLSAALVVGIYIIVGIATPILHPGREQGLTPSAWEPSHAGAFAANFVVIAAVAPAVEELTFRGLGFSLLERYGEWVAIIVVGILFGLYHGLVEALPVLAVFGAGLAWLRNRTASVYPCMLVHAAFNAIALIAAVTT